MIALELSVSVLPSRAFFLESSSTGRLSRHSCSDFGYVVVSEGGHGMEDKANLRLD
jgi:hypothetical protein